MMDNNRLDLLRSLQDGGISDPRVLDAIAQTPREAFIPEEALKPEAYFDEALPIECGQTISQPFVVAYMTERLHVMPEHDVLEIGTGSGYQAAILSRLARHVYTIERHRLLHSAAVLRFEALGLSNITAIHGDGMEGWPQARLFNRIAVTAGAEEIPVGLLKQLGGCGFMVLPLGASGTQCITLITRSGTHIEPQTLLPVRFVPLLAGHD